MRLIFIRHGKTKGNTEGRYVGRTDEPLLAESVEHLQKAFYPAARQVITSPMLRCRQSAAAIYPAVPAQVQQGLEEMDFGAFEYKNYQELCKDHRYQAYIDSGGQTGFPGGEPLQAFKERCCIAFQKVIEQLMEENGQVQPAEEKATGQAQNAGQAQEPAAAAFVVHGGTIMAIMEAFGEPKRGYFDWQVPNGAYIEGEYTEGKIRVKESSRG